MNEPPLQPDFLLRLDLDPSGAFEDFYRFAMHQLQHTPPRPMRTLTEDEREDLCHDIVYHCVKRDFQVLRRFRIQGKSFAGWLYVVAHHMTINYLRERNREYRVEGESSGPAMEYPGYEILPLVQQVSEALYSLSDNCRRVLQLAAHGYAPRDIARALALPPGANKKVSGQIAECRERLVQRLADKGVDILKWLGATK